MFKSEVLPAPLGPMIEAIAPRLSAIDTSSTARTPPNRFDTAVAASKTSSETPAEPADSKLYLTVKHRAYPVQPLFGLYWTYMGPEPAPPLRKLDIMEYPINRVRIENEFSANWVQVMENNLDGSHIFVLHQDTYAVGRDANGERPKADGTTRGLIRDLMSLDYQEVPAGIRRTMEVGDGYVEEDLLIFPNMLRRMNMLSLKVPVDDFHTKKFVVTVDMGLLGQLGSERGAGDKKSEADVYFRVPTNAKTPIDAPYPQATYSMRQLPHQDMMVIESQGARSPREAWRLGTRDDGIAFFDEMILREIDKVARGLSPIAVGEAFIDTNLEAVHAVGLR